MKHPSSPPGDPGTTGSLPASASAPDPIEAYIAACPAEVRPRLQQLRALIRAAAPQATERIAYRIPTFKGRRNLVHFAAFRHHLGLYPGAEAIEAFAAELADWPTSKGTLQLPLDRPLPEALITRIVQHAVARDAAGG